MSTFVVNKRIHCLKLDSLAYIFAADSMSQA